MAEKGTANGTITDIDGHFEITATSENSVLEIKYIRLSTKELLVGTKRQFEIYLSENTTELGEVVVTTLGVVKEKKVLGYSVQEIKGNNPDGLRQILEQKHVSLFQNSGYQAFFDQRRAGK